MNKTFKKAKIMPEYAQEMGEMSSLTANYSFKKILKFIKTIYPLADPQPL